MKIESNEDYLKAKKAIDRYEQELRKIHIKDYICSCCNKNTINVNCLNLPHILKQESGMWNNGVVVKAICGFGSRYDDESYYLAICDECLENNKNIININTLINKIC